MDIAMAETLNPVPFWFLRHGETDWNAEGRSQGRTDIALNAVGLAQARRAARTLAGVGGISPLVAPPPGRGPGTPQVAPRGLGLAGGFGRRAGGGKFWGPGRPPVGGWGAGRGR